MLRLVLLVSAVVDDVVIIVEFGAVGEAILGTAALARGERGEVPIMCEWAWSASPFALTSLLLRSGGVEQEREDWSSLSMPGSSDIFRSNISKRISDAPTVAFG